MPGPRRYRDNNTGEEFTMDWYGNEPPTPDEIRLYRQQQNVPDERSWYNPSRMWDTATHGVDDAINALKNVHPIDALMGEEQGLKDTANSLWDYAPKPVQQIGESLGNLAKGAAHMIPPVTVHRYRPEDDPSLRITGHPDEVSQAMGWQVSTPAQDMAAGMVETGQNAARYAGTALGNLSSNASDLADRYLFAPGSEPYQPPIEHRPIASPILHAAASIPELGGIASNTALTQAEQGNYWGAGASLIGSGALMYGLGWMHAGGESEMPRASWDTEGAPPPGPPGAPPGAPPVKRGTNVDPFDMESGWGDSGGPPPPPPPGGGVPPDIAPPVEAPVAEVPPVEPPTFPESLIRDEQFLPKAQRTPQPPVDLMESARLADEARMAREASVPDVAPPVAEAPPEQAAPVEAAPPPLNETGLMDLSDPNNIPPPPPPPPLEEGVPGDGPTKWPDIHPLVPDPLSTPGEGITRERLDQITAEAIGRAKGVIPRNAPVPNLKGAKNVTPGLERALPEPAKALPEPVAAAPEVTPTPEVPVEKPVAAPKAPSKPTPDRVLRIGRGQHDVVRTVFPDKAHADLFSGVGRTRKAMQGVKGIKANYEGLAQHFGVTEREVAQMASDYRAKVMREVKALPKYAPEGTDVLHYEAPRWDAKREGPSTAQERTPKKQSVAEFRKGFMQKVQERIPDAREQHLLDKTIQKAFQSLDRSDPRAQRALDLLRSVRVKKVEGSTAKWILKNTPEAAIKAGQAMRDVAYGKLPMEVSDIVDHYLETGEVKLPAPDEVATRGSGEVHTVHEMSPKERRATEFRNKTLRTLDKNLKKVPDLASDMAPRKGKVDPAQALADIFNKKAEEVKDTKWNPDVNKPKVGELPKTKSAKTQLIVDELSVEDMRNLVKDDKALTTRADKGGVSKEGLKQTLLRYLRDEKGQALVPGTASLKKLARSSFDVINQARMTSMLSGLAIPKSFAGNIGSHLTAALEHRTLEPFKVLTNVRAIAKDLKTGFIHNTNPAMTAGVGNFNLPGRIMGASDYAATESLVRAGISRADAREIMLTNANAIAKWPPFKGRAGQFFIPFKTIPFNQLGQALTRWKKYPGVYTAAVVLGALSGAKVKDKEQLALLSAFAGPYAVPFLAGAAISGGARNLEGISPIPEWGIVKTLTKPWAAFTESPARRWFRTNMGFGAAAAKEKKVEQGQVVGKMPGARGGRGLRRGH